MIATMPPPAPATVIVVRGETLSGIASDYGVSLRSIEASNPQIANPNSIYVGETVNLPNGSRTYQVTCTETVDANGQTYINDCSAPTEKSAPAPVQAEQQPADNPPPGPTSAPPGRVSGIPAWATCIVQRESGGDPTIQNQIPGYIGNGGGLFGDLKSTWDGYDGYSQPFLAPVSVQIQFNDALSHNGADLLPWAADHCPGT